jgi:hypothetical protein
MKVNSSFVSHIRLSMTRLPILPLYSFSMSGCFNVSSAQGSSLAGDNYLILCRLHLLYWIIPGEHWSAKSALGKIHISEISIEISVMFINSKFSQKLQIYALQKVYIFNHSTFINTHDKFQGNLLNISCWNN